MYQGLAAEALKQALKVESDNLGERAWEIYLKITRYAPSCKKRKYLLWVQETLITSENMVK